MSHQNASVKSIIFALSANFGIAVTKTVAAVITGSGSMLAESIHSFADCGNQLLLFLGLKTSKKQPNDEHPLGYGMSIYFWSFIVALMLFSMGGLFSIYEGIHKLHTNEPVSNPLVAIIVLSLSMLLEGASLLGCLKQIKPIRGEQSVWNWVKNTRQSELVVVLGEDVAALLGLAFALVFIVLSAVTGNPVYDSIGSIGIGTLLVVVSLFIATKVKGLLIGQSSDVTVRQDMKAFLEARPEVDLVFNLITIQLGSRIMVAVKAKMVEVATPGQMIQNINTCEKALRETFPNIQWIFFEPDVEDQND
ncbi:cation diffusion facilitator family transporter [Paludibacter jiangxiensis]|uniref:Cation diffusion facilitator family transporter n=1 Tax=Paludibacter jiangxiensis TaxID=681398 RepID=A0A170ZH24_9BACT|nr:cation diffusion facilitator family transporter [Paludibacter jiangxiensis]GAT62661.1 cation diffusion facilitator family transporter [Paludibacter jiangxiensis]